MLPATHKPNNYQTWTETPERRRPILSLQGQYGENRGDTHQNRQSEGLVPGVFSRRGKPCLAIEKNVSDVYKYTAKGNLVAVISNGTAV